MKDILLNGYLGKMGHVIINVVSARSDCRIVAAVDYKESDEALPFPTYTSFENVKEKPDVIIDFSHPSALEAVLKYATEHKIPAVIATTGLTEVQTDDIHAAADIVPIFFTANMSIGINLICELAKKAASVLYPDYNIEIIEQHHNLKLDAPSGTALLIADEISSVLEDQPAYAYDRHARREKRPQDEIGIHSVRAGTIVGEHEVIFGGKDEIIKISHSAMSKEIFATGAINAALFLSEKESGLYSMKDMLA